MSLRVWLPLTKDLKNQGLDNVTVTNNSATFDANGKLGGCYSFDGSTSFINTNINIPNFALDKTYSITCWVCPSGTSGQKPIIGIGSDWSWTIFQQNTDLRFVQWDESGSRWGDPAISGVFSVNTWVHIGVVWNQGVLLFYKNGEKIYEWTAPTSRTIKVSSDTVKIGGNIYAWGNNYFNGKLNDVRIYDHALSPLEVKRISQGLILHYPLNRNGWGQENLLPCGGQYTKNNPWFTTSNRTDGYTWVTNSAFQAIPSTTYTISVECDGTLSDQHGKGSIPISNKPFAFWLYICNTNTSKSWQSGAYDSAIILTSKTNNYKKIGNVHTWKYTLSSTQKYISLRTNSYSDGSTNITVNWWNMKIEKGDVFTPWCPNLSNELYNTLRINDNVEYDTSGYGNNGTKIGTFSYASDTPKYNVSAIFNGTERIKRNTLDGEIYTLACWAKTTKNKSTSQQIIADSKSEMTISFYNGTIIGVFGTTRGTGSKSTLGSSYKENNWNHFVVVKTGISGERAIYCNGVLLTPTSNDYWGSASGFFVGARNDSQGNPFYGQICDVRAYATALSTQDVLSLYNNSAYIDNQGNIYGAVYEEV